MQSALSRRSPWLYVPPPPLFVVSFLLGVMLGRAFDLHLGANVANVAKIAGVLIIATGASLVLSAPAMFAWHRTTIVPHRSARTLLTSGPYRITRNPMYLGLMFLYLGIALATNQLAAVVFLPLPLWVLATKTIPYEEAMLDGLFGDEYRAYAKRVRRWL